MKSGTFYLTRQHFSEWRYIGLHFVFVLTVVLLPGCEILYKVPMRLVQCTRISLTSLPVAVVVLIYL